MVKFEPQPFKQIDSALLEDYEDFYAIDAFMADAYLDNRLQIDILLREHVFISSDINKHWRKIEIRNRVATLRALNKKMFDYFYDCLYGQRSKK